MLKKLQFIILLLIATAPVFAQKVLTAETPEQKTQRMAWWQNDRFGMFIHWGLYALPARHEWVKSAEKITNAKYEIYFDTFNPDLYNPKFWAQRAKAAGMKYAVLTTKHHEGFCLFDSKFTDYKATNTAAKRDLVKEYVDAFRAQGIKIGFYYSLLDWHHPDYTIDEYHPQSPKDKSDTAYARLNKGRDMVKYRLYLRNQVTELLTKYGKIDILWLDFSFPRADGHGKGKDDWGSVELLKLIKKLQPGIIVDNRLDLAGYAGGEDFETPEQVSTDELLKFRGKTWETCQTFSGSWGYHRDENSWKSPKQLLDLLITATANGGNLILNVGPTARGEFDFRANNRLDSLSYWMHANSKSIYGCTYAPSEFKAPENTRLTYNAKAKRLYVHLFKYDGGEYKLPGFRSKVKYAQFLHDNSELVINTEKSTADDLVINLPKDKPRYEVPVIELILK
ncbi:alpha-L-fucosidase [Mucilaginibacter gynuensis]|uniref:alpha-L-fucosidase n=1 Tax=Mucilaginibacter gynuensis TaxID=1302236 RepID=A0ABP8G8P3_9SPHI